MEVGEVESVAVLLALAVALPVGVMLMEELLETDEDGVALPLAEDEAELLPEALLDGVEDGLNVEDPVPLRDGVLVIEDVGLIEGLCVGDAEELLDPEGLTVVVGEDDEEADSVLVQLAV